MRTEYFRDATVAFEAFKAGQIDFRDGEYLQAMGHRATISRRCSKGLVKKEEFRHHLPTGMQGFAMNTRRDLFKDRGCARRWRWRSTSSGPTPTCSTTPTRAPRAISATATSPPPALPAATELALLEPFSDKLPPELFTEPFKLPVTDGSGNNREELRAALALLQEAGWTVKDRKLVDATGKPISFEILLDEPAFERVALPYVQWLARLGIDAQRAHRRSGAVPAADGRIRFRHDGGGCSAESDSPGNEQTGYWTCAAREAGGRATTSMGICDPVVDALVGKVIDAPATATVWSAATRALDRVLLWGWYVVPQWHLQSVRVAYWDRFGRPAQAGAHRVRLR